MWTCFLIDDKAVENNSMYTKSDFKKLNFFITERSVGDVSFVSREELDRRTVHNNKDKLSNFEQDFREGSSSTATLPLRAVSSCEHYDYITANCYIFDDHQHFSLTFVNSLNVLFAYTVLSTNLLITLTILSVPFTAGTTTGN